MNTQVSLIGAPTDIGAGARGASMGPEALRVANIVPVLQGHGLEVVDRGNLAGPANPWQPPVDGYRHLAEVVAWNRLVHDAVHAELAQRPPADPARRRPLPGHRLDQRGGAPLPRERARSCACCGSTRTPTSTPTC